MRSKQSDHPVSQRTKSSINRRIIGRMMILMVLLSIGGLFLYSFFRMQSITSIAESSIARYRKDRMFYYYDRGDDYYFTYDLYVKEDSSFYIDDQEKDLAEHYLKNKSTIHNDRLYHYFHNGYCSVFVAVDMESWEASNPQPEDVDPEWNEKRKEDAVGVILYCDITYLITSLRRDVLVIGAIIAIMLALLFAVSRYTVKVLDSKDTAMKNFFANASHELKTPLMAIRGNVDGIRSNYVQVSDGCEVIDREVDRMSRLISGILDISKLDSGAVEPELMNNDVREILFDAVSSIEQEAVRRGIQLQVDLPDPIFRKCDENMLFSAFSNILTNDIRYADSLILVRAVKETAGSSENGRVRIHFENDGPPISEEGMQHVFDRFYKGTKGQSGIGMALAQEYIRLHGSEIKVLLSEGRTAFEILL